MALDAKPTSELIQIAAAGGGFRLNAKTRSIADLVQIAAAAKNGGATVIFAGISARRTTDLVQIGAAGKGAVIFED